MRYSILLLCSICFFFRVEAQSRITTNNFNAWYQYFGNYKLNEKWGLHAEGQWRRNGVLKNPQQILFRVGLNYFLNPVATVSGGYCFVHTSVYGGLPPKAAFPEHRFWQQFQLRNPLGSVELISRFRLEQRWLYLPVLENNLWQPGKAVYQNRARVLQRISVPFRGKTIENNSFYISVYDEVMINFGNQVGINIFDQNRVYIALGYRFPKLGRFELGYLNQRILKSDGIKVENNHTLQLGLTQTLHLFSKQK